MNSYKKYNYLLLIFFVGIHLTLHAFDFSSLKDTFYSYWSAINKNINEHKKLYLYSAAALAVGGASWWAYIQYRKNQHKKERQPIQGPPTAATSSTQKKSTKKFLSNTEKQIVRKIVENALNSYVNNINNPINSTTVKGNTPYEVKDSNDKPIATYSIASLPTNLAYQATITYEDGSENDYLRRYPSSINWSLIPNTTKTVIKLAIELYAQHLLNNQEFYLIFDDPLASLWGIIHILYPIENQQRNFKIHFMKYNENPDVFFIDKPKYEVDINGTSGLLQQIKNNARSIRVTDFNRQYAQYLLSGSREASFGASASAQAQPAIPENLRKQAFDVLKLRFNAPQDEIKKQYRKLARIYHPDSKDSGAKPSAVLFNQIQSAYELLTDQIKEAELKE